MNKYQHSLEFEVQKLTKGGLGIVEGNHPTLAKFSVICKYRCESSVQVTDMPSEGRQEVAAYLLSICFNED